MTNDVDGGEDEKGDGNVDEDEHADEYEDGDDVGYEYIYEGEKET